ncbi:hypothetical protein LTS18_009202, partial [Coniosporium uncinatum]
PEDAIAQAPSQDDENDSDGSDAQAPVAAAGKTKTKTAIPWTNEELQFVRDQLAKNLSRPQILAALNERFAGNQADGSIRPPRTKSSLDSVITKKKLRATTTDASTADDDANASEKALSARKTPVAHEELKQGKNRKRSETGRDDAADASEKATSAQEDSVTAGGSTQANKRRSSADSPDSADEEPAAKRRTLRGRRSL